jgi:FG-GAP repeat
MACGEKVHRPKQGSPRGSTRRIIGFGQSAAISGNEVVIGAPGAKVGTQIQGAAYFFVKPSTGWANATSGRDLIASDGAAFDNFGVSVAVSGSTIVAGAPKSATPGSAYVFGP